MVTHMSQVFHNDLVRVVMGHDTSVYMVVSNNSHVAINVYLHETRSAIGLAFPPQPLCLFS